MSCARGRGGRGPARRADGARERRVAPALCRRFRRPPGASGSGARGRRIGGAEAPPAQRAGRRAAAAGGHRPGPGPRPGDPAGRRAHRQPRLEVRRRDHAPAARLEHVERHDADLRHPRPGHRPAYRARHPPARRAGGSHGRRKEDRMNLREAVLEAVESLSSNKLRSGLTVLGIVIGVGAVIAMLGIGRGAQATITGSISDIGTNLLFVFEGGADDVRNPRPLTLGDAQAISDGFQAPSVERVAPLLQGSVEVTYGGESTVTQGMGVTTAYESVRNVEMAEGEFISEEHLLGRAAVAVIAPDTAERLFGRTEGLVGETIRIEGQPFRILGVTVARGGGGFNNEDDRGMGPLTTAPTRCRRRRRKSPDCCEPATAHRSAPTISPSSPSRTSWPRPRLSPTC